MKRRLWVNFAILSLTVFGFKPAQLVADETKRNVRELCRLEVASVLLQNYNDLAIVRDQIALGEQRGREFLLHLTQVQSDLNVITQKPRAGMPSPELDEREHSLRFQIETLRRQQLESEKDLSQNKAKHKELDKDRESLEQLLQPVFAYTISRGEKGWGLPQHIRYHHVCGPYQLLCPLPREQAEALKKISAGLGSSQACERYSGLALPSPRK